MERLKKLNFYQKAVLILMILMCVVFIPIYAKTISCVGYAYNGEILVPSEEAGGISYTGKMHGQKASFTVTEDKAVYFQYGDKTYGPYTVKEDPTAIPAYNDIPEMVGLEILQGDSVLFRGGALENPAYNDMSEIVGLEILQGNSALIRSGALELGDRYVLYLEDSANVNPVIAYANGANEADRVPLTAKSILELRNGPALTHKGDWSRWLYSALICIINALSIVFIDELFRLKMYFRVRNSEGVEPSEWEIAARYLGWTALLVGACITFIAGLK